MKKCFTRIFSPLYLLNKNSFGGKVYIQLYGKHNWTLKFWKDVYSYVIIPMKINFSLLEVPWSMFLFHKCFPNSRGILFVDVFTIINLFKKLNECSHLVNILIHVISFMLCNICEINLYCHSYQWFINLYCWIIFFVFVS